MNWLEKLELKILMWRVKHNLVKTHTAEDIQELLDDLKK